VRVHFLASTLAQGGAEVMAVALSGALADRGHGVTWSLLRDPGVLGDRLPARFDLAPRLVPERVSLSGMRRLRDRLRGADALYVLDHRNAVIHGGGAARAARVRRRVVAVHTTGLWGGRPSLGRTFRVALRAYDRVLALSPTHAGYLAGTEGVAESRIAIVPNGIRLDRFSKVVSKSQARTRLGLPPDALVVGSVAMLRPEKNLLGLLAAAAALENDRVHVVLVGDGPERVALDARAGRPDLAGRVHVLGRRDDVPDLLRAFDVFALASHPEVETQPVSVLEAMASGVPVLATRVGDLGSMLEEGACGVLVPHGDPGALAAALRGLLDDEPLRDRMAARGRVRVRDFDLARSTDALERVLFVEAA